MTLPAVDVVVLTWNDGPLLDAALASIDAAVGVTASAIVVDNGSDPPAVVPAGVQLVRNDANLGVARGRNMGVRSGTSPLVCLLDSDAALRPDALARMVEVLRSESDVGLVAPVFEDQPPDASAGRAPTLRRKLARASGLTARYGSGSGWSAGQRDIDFAIGACQLFRREAFDAVHGLDESYFYGPEDVDFCLRIRLAGWRVVQVETPVVHPPRRRNRKLFTRRGVAHGRAVARHLWRHRGIQRRLARVDRARA